MGPLPEEPHNKPSERGSDGNDDNEEYVRDGWRLGFEVEMNGVGMEQMVVDQDDGESESEGYEGPGDGSDAEENEIRRAGYQQLTMNPNPEELNPDTSGNEDDFEKIQSRVNSAAPPPLGCLPNSIKKDFKEALDSADKVHLKDSDFVTESSSNRLDLNPEKIETIREVASKFKLTPPTWAKDVDDEKLKEMLNNIKAKRTL